MILGASGENIYPEEIEALINQSPFVDESLVYGDGTSVAALGVRRA
jgi:long-chain acyl-CoA synthetase